MVYDGDAKLIADGKPVFYVGMGQPDSLTEELTGARSVVLE